MSKTIYHIKIKKEYAFSIIEDLLQNDAIEMVEENIPEWQQTESVKRLNNLISHPETGLSEEEFFHNAMKDDEKI